MWGSWNNNTLSTSDNILEVSHDRTSLLIPSTFFHILAAFEVCPYLELFDFEVVSPNRLHGLVSVHFLLLAWHGRHPVFLSMVLLDLSYHLKTHDMLCPLVLE